jgi:hypothetical protein
MGYSCIAAGGQVVGARTFGRGEITEWYQVGSLPIGRGAWKSPFNGRLGSWAQAQRGHESKSHLG